MIESALYSLLSNDPGISVLVGIRIYPVTAKQGTAIPYIRFQNMNMNQEIALTGPTSYHDSLIRIDSLAATVLDAKTLGLKIKTLLNNFSGILAGITIHRIIYKGETDSLQDAVDSEMGIHGITQTYSFYFNE